MAKKYCPSNGAEGEWFMSKFCYHCAHERWIHYQDENKEEDKCQILSNTLIYGIKDKEFPEEWTYDEQDKPICTNYQNRDWDKFDDDGNNNPPEPPPYDPDQLTLPFMSEQVENILLPQEELNEAKS